MAILAQQTFFNYEIDLRDYGDLDASRCYLRFYQMKP